MCKERVMFKALQDYNNDICVANNQLIPCGAEGEVSLALTTSGRVNVNDVLYVLGLSANLLSVSAMVDKDFKVIFEKSECTVTKEGEV